MLKEMEINAAADHGVNVFIFDWYWYDGMPFLEGCLNNGYLKAEFEVICHRIIDKYFSHLSYYKVDGKPSFMIYDLNTFIQGLGGVEQTKTALNWFREETVKAGYKGLDLQLTLGRSGSDVTDIAGDNIGSRTDVIQKLGFDGLTHYQYCHFTDINKDYMEIMKDVVFEWGEPDKKNAAPYYPHVSIGWDNNPRFEMFIKGIVKNNTPANFEKALIMARGYADAHPNQAPLITKNSWNEWTETSYLQPCTMYGYGYLNAVMKVFMEDLKNK
jgi:hypothetical protein